MFNWGSDAQRAFIRDQVMTGRQRLAVAVSEPDSGSDAAALRTSAQDRGDHFLVNGQKMWCTGAGLPDTTIATYVRTGPREPKHEGISLLLIDPRRRRGRGPADPHPGPAHPGHQRGVPVRRGGAARRTWSARRTRGGRVMLSNLELEKVIITGGYLGAAQATLDEMLAFAKTRHAFGRPVGTFQALAHAMADLQVEIDSARLLAYRAAWLLAQGKPCGREGSMAKLKGSETYVAAARLGMQVCAGHGFSTESVMSFRYRESIVATISGGTSQIQRNGIARSMGLRTY